MRDEVSQDDGRPRRSKVDEGKYPGLWQRERADGKLIFEIKIRQGGRLSSRSLPASTTKTDAIAAWRKMASQRDEGAMPVARNVRLSSVAAEAFSDLGAKVEAGLRSERTHQLYLIRWRLHIEPRLGSKRLNKLGPREVLNLVADLREEGHAEWTVHGITVVLRFVLRHARHSGFATNDPFATIPPDELPQQRVSESFNRRVLRPDEIEKLLTRIPPSLRNLVTFIAFSGVRVSEGCGLQWGDVSLIEGTVAIREQLAPLKRQQNPRRVRLKSRASARVVPLLPRSSQALEAQYERSERDRRVQDGDYVFATASGRPVSRHRVYGAVATAARKAGLGEGVNPQTLRRTVSTATAHAGLPAVVGASITGHSREVYDRDYVTPFRDAAEREQVRNALANIGFGSLEVDQTLTSEPGP